MKLKLDMQGQTFGPFVNKYSQRDLMLFALGCGAGLNGKDELQYVYEKDLKVLPIFYVVPIVDTNVTKTIDFGFEYGGSLHWSIDLKIHKPLQQMQGTLTTHVLLNGLFDRGPDRGLLAQHIGETRDESGELLFTCESWDCCIYDGGWGGPKAAADIVDIPERSPDHQVQETVPLNQAIIYRLSGDYHPQHVDWEYAQKFGNPKPNLHGVSTAGIACRHLISSLLGGDPERLTRFKVRFTKPLYPGASLVTQIWQVDEHRAHFRVADAQDPNLFYLNFGVVEWR